MQTLLDAERVTAPGRPASVLTALERQVSDLQSAEQLFRVQLASYSEVEVVAQLRTWSELQQATTKANKTRPCWQIGELGRCCKSIAREDAVRDLPPTPGGSLYDRWKHLNATDRTKAFKFWQLHGAGIKARPAGGGGQ